MMLERGLSGSPFRTTNLGPIKSPISRQDGWSVFFLSSSPLSSPTGVSYHAALDKIACVPFSPGKVETRNTMLKQKLSSRTGAYPNFLRLSLRKAGVAQLRAACLAPAALVFFFPIAAALMFCIRARLLAGP